MVYFRIVTLLISFEPFLALERLSTVPYNGAYWVADRNEFSKIHEHAKKSVDPQKRAFWPLLIPVSAGILLVIIRTESRNQCYRLQNNWNILLQNMHHQSYHDT